MNRYLSHKLLLSNPVYGNISKDIGIGAIKSIDKGDACQTFWIRMENHWGTHVDCPAHFFLDGKNVCDYDCDFWFFKNPQVIKIIAKPGQIITIEHIKDRIDIDTDIILFVSGWENFRGQNIYSLNNPGLHPDIALWLRQSYPSVRAVGIDWISISAFQQKEIGRLAHKAFLNPYSEGHPVLLIEDMKLSGDISYLEGLFVSPILIDKIDSAPCTVVGIFKDYQ